jgi:hypothetical protein
MDIVRAFHSFEDHTATEYFPEIRFDEFEDQTTTGQSIYDTWFEEAQWVKTSIPDPYEELLDMQLGYEYQEWKRQIKRRHKEALHFLNNKYKLKIKNFIFSKLVIIGIKKKILKIFKQWTGKNFRKVK